MECHSEFIVFFSMKQRTEKISQKWPMYKIWIFCKSQKFIELKLEYFIYFFSSIWDDILYFLTVMCNIEVCLPEYITRTFEDKPELPCIALISRLFQKFTLSTFERIFIWSIEGSSWEGKKRFIP